MTADPAADARAAITLARAIAPTSAAFLVRAGDTVTLARGVLALQAYGERLRFLLETKAVVSITDSSLDVASPIDTTTFTAAQFMRAQNEAVHDWIEATTECGRPL